VDGHLVEQDPSDLEDQEDTDNRMKGQKIDFVALSVPYFLGAIAPDQEYDSSGPKPAIRGENKNGAMLATLVSPLTKLDTGSEKSWDFMVYYGPRDLKVLEPLGHGLAAAVDFGWFDVIAKPMLIALNFFYDLIPNYGIAIIIVTILIKLLFWPLTRKSYKSMKEMQKLQPQVAKVREKYKDDKQRQQQEIMQLYKTYKVNPMGGCLPMVVQIPVFIAFYKVLGSAIELRHAPFMLWINDLSAPDRLFPQLGIPWVEGIPVLTLLMGASMFIQQKMTPTTGDPTQAKMMMLMPVVFTFMFISFPSGLVLYWLVNNLLSIGQQTFVNKKG
jgi:YidC/Oxa1 family membrane protein insertase